MGTKTNEWRHPPLPPGGGSGLLSLHLSLYLFIFLLPLDSHLCCSNSKQTHGNKIATFRDLCIDLSIDLQAVTGFRRQQSGFLDVSFPTIAGANGNGAIIHYRADPDSCAMVDEHSLLLLDSGAQVRAYFFVPLILASSPHL